MAALIPSAQALNNQRSRLASPWHQRTREKQTPQQSQTEAMHGHERRQTQMFGTAADINQDFFSFPKIENKGRYQYKQELSLLNQRFIQTDWYECSPTMTPKCNDTNATRATLFMPSASS
jgi:hypothetical protein